MKKRKNLLKNKDMMEELETETSEKTEVEAPEMELIEACNAWAFIMGPSANAFCTLPKGHEGEHQLSIIVYSEPKSHFTIYWALDS